MTISRSAASSSTSSQTPSFSVILSSTLERVIKIMSNIMIYPHKVTSGYKESDDSEKVVMEPKLIAVQGHVMSDAYSLI